ncbi:MAG: amino acid deaminase, partial [Actinomycetota bacterium]|nr:amino acid deaminase [Actinomycetota bacterium]
STLHVVEQYLGRMREVVAALRFETPTVIVSAGGSAFFDLVADALTVPWPAGLNVLPVLRSGAYITHDDGHYRSISPLGANSRLDGPTFRSALRAWAQVVSQPEPGLALLAAGKRDVPYDIGLPEPQLLRTAAGVRPLTGAKVTALADQHAFLSFSAEAPVEVGDWVGLGLSHPCTTFDKWSLLPVTDTDGETVTDLVRTFF